MPVIILRKASVDAGLQTIVLSVDGNLSFNNSTNIELSPTYFTIPGTYTIITYTGSLFGFSNLSVTPPAGLSVAEIIDASSNKAIKVRLV